MKRLLYIPFIALICIATIAPSHGQGQITEQDSISRVPFFKPAPKFDKFRFYSALGLTGTAWGGFSYALYNTWYRQFPQREFHFFNDLGEWNNMDKAGHIYTAYFQSNMWYTGSRWTGVGENKSILTGVLAGTAFQSTIEIMDAFSSGWGFSIADYSSNMMGVGAFYFQQKHWGEQRIHFKMSSFPKKYPDITLVSADGTTSSLLTDRTDDLFGTNYFTSFLKDYNAQTIWASANVASFLSKESKFPNYLNVAIGYGAENLYGGFENVWEVEGKSFSTNSSDLDRYHQFYLALDIDLTRIPAKNHFLRTILHFFNIFKMPSPALEFNSRGELIFHLIHL